MSSIAPQPVSVPRAVHNSLAIVALDLSTKLLPLVTFPWVVRALGPVSYGKVGFALAVAGFFGLLAAPGFYSYGIREVAREPWRAPDIAAELTGARIVFAACSYLLLVVFTFTLAPADDLTRRLLLLAGLSFIVAPLDLRWLFVGVSRMWAMALAGILGQIAYAAMLLGLIRGPADAWVMPAAAVAAALIPAVVMLRLAMRRFRVSWPRFAARRWPAFLPACLTLGLASMMSLVYDQIDTVMLRYLRTEHEVGIYAASYRIMTLALSFMPVLQQVFFPMLASAAQHEGDEHRYFRWLGQATLALTLPIALGGFLLAGPITAFLLGPRYPGSERLLRWLMFNLLAGPLASFCSARLVTHRRERQYLLAVSWGAVLNVVLNLVFIPTYGAIAAVWTTAFSQLAVALAAFYFTRDLKWPDLARPGLIAVLATASMCLGVIALRRFHLHVLLVIFAGAAVYAAAYMLSRLLLAHLRPRPA